MLIGGIVDRVVGNGGSECAGNDALQRTGTGNAAELNVLKQEARSIIKGRDAGARESVREPQTSERKLLYRIRGKHGESCAVLIVALDELRIDTHRLALQERQLASLVETVAAGEDRKTGRDGAIEKIGLGEAEHEAALNVAELSGEGESFAEAEKIVGLIGETDERAGQAADPALQTDRLLALFLELQSEIDSAFFLIALDLNRFVFLDAVEVIELVQTQDADFPGALVEKLALIEKKFAADDFVAGGGIADKIDAADVILLFFVKAQGGVNALGGVVDIKLGLGGEIDEAVLAVGFGVILHGFADFGGGKDVALRSIFPLKDGDIFSAAKIRKAMQDYTKAYGQYGFIDFTAEPQFDIDDTAKRIDTTLRFNEEKQYYVRRIDFVGNTTTRDKVIRRELLLDEGQLFNKRAWEISILRLNQLDYL